MYQRYIKPWSSQVFHLIIQGYNTEQDLARVQML